MSDTGTEHTYWRVIDPPRPLTRWERDVLNRLLSLPFPGHHRVLEQVRAALVREDSTRNPSVILTIPRHIAPVLDEAGQLEMGVIPVELAGKDADGMEIGVVLGWRAGYIDFLDVHRYDGEPFLRLPDPGQLEIRCR
jgi:hypothetical protein